FVEICKFRGFEFASSAPVSFNIRIIIDFRLYSLSSSFSNLTFGLIGSKDSSAC
ncbi:hypothetical protein A2U01_0048624, partial [Trifolium medium]|nr:hypothetical protein [Trifolium medium]